jgi:hypothetical protein
MEFPAAVEGKQGKCPSCNIVVTVENNSLVDLASLQQQQIPKQPEPSPTDPVQQQSVAQQPAATKDVPLEMGTTTFAKDNLTAGETILHAGRFHLFRVKLARAIFLLSVPIWLCVSFFLLENIGVFDSGFVHKLLAAPIGGPRGKLDTIMGLFCFGPGPILLTWLVYRWEYNKAHKTEFVLTNQRLIAKWGFLRTVTREIQLDKIESVDYGQSLFERWYGVGRLTVRGSGGGKVGKFKYLLDALEFRKRFLAQIDRVKM